MPNAAALWMLLRVAHHHNVAVEQACRERMPRHHEQVETHGPYLDESATPDDPATPEQPKSLWKCVLTQVAKEILKTVPGAGASTEAALHDQKNLEGVCEKLRGHYEPLMKATSRRQPGEKVCEERCEQDESNAKDKETENLSNALADDIREVFAIERLCDGLDLSRNWEITLPGKGQRLLDDLFLLLESRGWTAQTVANFQKGFPTVAAEMGLETLVEAAPAAGGETPADADQPPEADCENSDTSQQSAANRKLLDLLAELDCNTGEVVKLSKILNDTNLTAEAKCRQACELMPKLWLKVSPWWANLLDVTPQAITKRDFWKVDRPRVLDRIEEEGKRRAAERDY